MKILKRILSRCRQFCINGTSNSDVVEYSTPESEALELTLAVGVLLTRDVSLSSDSRSFYMTYKYFWLIFIQEKS